MATHNGAVLDTIQLCPRIEQDKRLRDRQFILKFNGNGMLYEDALQNFTRDAERLQTTVVGFNYRKVCDVSCG